MPQLSILAASSVLLLTPTPGPVAPFVPPSADTALAAIGALESLPALTQRLLTPDGDFAAIEIPSPGDWLAEHEEAGQTFDAFVATGADIVTRERTVIYLQPLGEFPIGSSPALEALEEYATAFFQMTTVVLPPAPVDARKFRSRVNVHTHKPQILTTPILSWLRAGLPADAHCLIGVTMSDLYPAESWNYVFGQASLRERTGVFSFARSDPGFFGEERPDDVATLILQRSAKTLVHEIAHMFGLRHCIFYRCVENGANNQKESDRAPQHLCPVCLRKLFFATSFDPGKRYRDLQYFYSTRGWTDDEAWVTRQLARLKTSSPEVAPLDLPAVRAPEVSPISPTPPLIVPPIVIEAPKEFRP